MDKGFTQIPNSILVDKRLSVYEKIVYSVILMRCIDKDNCWPSLTTISKDSCISRPKVVSSIKRLVDMGLLKKGDERSENNSSVYTITDRWLTTLTNNSKHGLLVNGINQPDSKRHLPEMVNGVNSNNIKQEDKENKLNNITVRTYVPEQKRAPVKNKKPPKTYEAVSKEINAIDIEAFQEEFVNLDIQELFANFSDYCLGQTPKSIEINPSNWINFVAAFRNNCKLMESKGRYIRDKPYKKKDKSLPDWYHNTGITEYLFPRYYDMPFKVDEDTWYRARDRFCIKHYGQDYEQARDSIVFVRANKKLIEEGRINEWEKEFATT